MKDFIELIKDNAKNYPQRIAVIDRDRKITYADFFDLVNSISNQLITFKAKPKVIFDLKQSIEAYALVIAVLKIGGTYCPLNPDAPIESKLQIVKEFSPDIIVVETSKGELELKSNKTVIINWLLSEKNNSEVNTIYNGEDIIYVIYTSGTTGAPKGVMIYRKALNKFLEWSIPTYGANGSDVWGQYSFLSFDLSIVDIFTCLCSGATLYAMNDIAAKKNRPAGEIEKEKITVWHSIPSAIEFMIVNEKTNAYDFSSLRLASFCGETLKKQQVEFLFKKNKELAIFNTYGPTEGTLFCTCQELDSNNYLEYCHYSISIGKPIPGWKIKLTAIEGFDEKEVIIYGDYIGKGYLDNISDTKFKLIEIDGKKERGFETGDLVYERNRNLYFSCRKDRQVKIKGFRVELDEIDFRINEFLGKTSVTVEKKDTLYSFIETKDSLNEAALREFLVTKLETFKIPNGFYPINKIPRSQNQKVDINALTEKLP